MLGGFETYIYRIVLAQQEGAQAANQPPAGVPLILRLGWRTEATQALLWEAAAMAAARAAGVPVPRVYRVESDSGPLGGPFMLMEFARGLRMFEAALQAGPIGLLRMVRNYARAQTAICRVRWRPPPELLPAAPSALAMLGTLDERLARLRAEVEQRHLDFLLPVVAWLEQHRGVLAGRPRVFLHGDCHPLNIFIERGQVTAIIDWSAAGFGERHEDIGWVSMLIATASSPEHALDRRLGVFRAAGRWAYLAFVWEAARLDRAALRYGEVEGALRWCLIFLPSYLPDAGEPVLNADAAAALTPVYLQRVRRFIERRTRLRLRFPGQPQRQSPSGNPGPRIDP